MSWFKGLSFFPTHRTTLKPFDRPGELWYTYADVNGGNMPYTTRQLAKEAGVSMARIRQLCISGELKCEKFGPVWLIPDEEAERWLTERQGKRPAD